VNIDVVSVWDRKGLSELTQVKSSTSFVTSTDTSRRMSVTAGACRNHMFCLWSLSSSRRDVLQ